MRQSLLLDSVIVVEKKDEDLSFLIYDVISNVTCFMFFPRCLSFSLPTASAVFMSATLLHHNA